jgi:RecB family endonuclease NucS
MTIAIPAGGGTPIRQLEMKFAGALVKHLGLQMYSGAVAAIAELISNSWDADAPSVAVSIPFDTAIDPTSEITIDDDGSGMSFDEVNEKYLMLGRNRRLAEGDYSPGGRPVLGRKGIGKLAGFGIAKVVEIWTVNDGHLTAFSMDYDQITDATSGIKPYEPNVLHDRAVAATDPIQKGTRIVLKRLQLTNRINEDRFLRGMNRRFSLLSEKFAVTINGTSLSRFEMPLQFRFPAEGWTEADVPGIGAVKWWAGFTEKPIQVEESRGVAVLARGKLAQAPFFFELSGGAGSQLGLQYLTGEVVADGLDSGADLIATDRASVLWENPIAKPLLDWGQGWIREMLREWSKGRRASQVKRLRDHTQYMSLIEKFPERERAELLSAIDTLSSIETIENERLDEIVRILIQAYENDHFLDVIRSLRDLDESALDEVAALINEWDVIEAVQTAQLVRGRVELIRAFEDMIDRGVPEKPDMQDFLRDHPWLIDPSWQMLAHEKSLDGVLEKQFNKPKARKKRGGKRLDFLCLGDSTHAVVVEVKRPGLKVGVTELRQLEDYLLYMNRWNNASNGTPVHRSKITGVLIYSHMDPEAEDLASRLRDTGDVIITSWSGLLETAQRLHREYLDLMKSRAPGDDPRIVAIADLDEKEPGSQPPANDPEPSTADAQNSARPEEADRDAEAPLNAPGDV